jgi:flagellar biosynthesis protein FlhG
MRIIPVASGKGGVGKSLLTANLGVAFAQKGKNVVLADLDLGASNLHLIIGHRKPGASLGSFLTDPKTDFNKVVATTDIPNLRFIPGDAEIPGMANLRVSDRNKIIRNLTALDADILLLDLGAGTHQSILDFFLSSGQGIIVSAPMVTAVLNAYVFLKNACFRLMYSSFPKKSKAWTCLETLKKNEENLKMLYLPRVLAQIEQIDGESYAKFKANMDRFHPRLVINMLEDPKDAEAALKIRRSCEAYLGMQIEHLGVIYRDSVQNTALAARMPVLLYKPQSLVSQAIYRIADKILSSPEDTLSMDRELIDDSFDAASTEAEIDYESRFDYVEELLHSGELTQGDLIETIKTQQLEINKMRKENNLLKVKLSTAAEAGFKI